MCPQFVDFNADGFDDIITATFEGTAFLVPGSAEGWQQPEYEGRLYLQRNEGEAGAPAFTGVNELLMAGDEPFNVPGGLTAPRPVDGDGDGLVDLICGGFTGGVFLYRNAGGLAAPRFEAPVSLLGRRRGSPVPSGPSRGCYVDPVDYDGDGDLDLLVGGYAEWSPQARELTEAEQQRLTEMDKQLEVLDSELNAIYQTLQQEAEGLSDEELEAFYEQKSEQLGLDAKQEQSQALWEEKEGLVPGPQEKAGIWLYTRE